MVPDTGSVLVGLEVPPRYGLVEGASILVGVVVEGTVVEGAVV